MAPWDELPFFDLPRSKTVSITNVQPTQLATADPMRVLIMMQVVGATTALIDVTSGVNASGGFTLLSTTLPLILHHRDHPVLAQSEWWGLGTVGAQNVQVMTVAMTRWPKSAQDNMMLRLCRLEGALERLRRAIERCMCEPSATGPQPDLRSRNNGRYQGVGGEPTAMGVTTKPPTR